MTRSLAIVTFDDVSTAVTALEELEKHPDKDLLSVEDLVVAFRNPEHFFILGRPTTEKRYAHMPGPLPSG